MRPRRGGGMYPMPAPRHWLTAALALAVLMVGMPVFAGLI